MIIKGKSRSNGAQLGQYLLHSEENEEAVVLGISGLATEDAKQALIEMQEITDSGQRGVQGLYHSVINPQPGYQLNTRQWHQAADILAKELQLEDQPRVIVLHQKNDHVHAHIVFQRTDPESLTLRSDSWNYMAHEKAARRLERIWDHDLVPGKHADPKMDDPAKSKSYDQIDTQQAKQSGISRADRVAQVTSLYKGSDSAAAFVNAMEHEGYALARGDKRGFVFLDTQGRVFSLARYIDGRKTKDIRAFMQPVDLEKLPSVDTAKAQMKQRADAKRDAAAKTDKAKAAFNDAAQAKHSPDVKAELNKTAKKTSSVGNPKDRVRHYVEALSKRLTYGRAALRGLTHKAASKLQKAAKGFGHALASMRTRRSSPEAVKDRKTATARMFEKAAKSAQASKANPRQAGKQKGLDHDR